MADLITMLQAAAGVGGINPREYFNTVLWTGDGTSPRSITGVGFAPDFVWIKNRVNGARFHVLNDIVRGANKQLYSNATNAEETDTENLKAFNSDGFSIGNNLNVNESTSGIVAWNWKANGAGVSNTDGTITSTVSANTTAGISIVTWTGAGSTGTVGHGLGFAPKLIITKNRTDSATVWYTYTTAIDGSLDRLQLESTAAKVDVALNLPTSTVFSAGATTEAVSGKNYVAYCFAEVEGFSKFGSYTGNGSATGPSVTTDFEPTWLMIKRTDSTGDWIIHDSARDASNPRTEYLEPNTSDAEATGNDVDFNSTGFQLKSTSATINASGGTYIYACFA